jgi:CheY-like chemotaxis protein
MRILVVDDDSFSGEMTAAILQDAGHEIVLVDNGVEAVGILADDRRFAAVISDLNMPFLSGLELFATLCDEGCTLPFILLSGEDPDSLRRSEPRLTACIAKDGNLETSLQQALERVLTTRDA